MTNIKFIIKKAEEQKIMAEIEDIDIKVNRFYSLIKDYKEGAPETRYKSWEWCHKVFFEKKEEYRKAQNEDDKNKIVEFLSLHFAFYLALGYV